MTTIVRKSESKFLGHERCPRCAEEGADRSGNNLGVWDDGHKWCFKCSYYVEASSQKDLLLRKINDAYDARTDATKESRKYALPVDCTNSIPDAPRNWLKKYQITPNEVAQNRIVWSPSWERLIWPHFTPQGKLMFWQGRRFGHVEDGKPKYYNSGDPSTIMDLHGEQWRDTNGKVLVIVEDKLSAIKVGRFTTVMPLYGSSLPITQIRGLSVLFDRVILWLDNDMAFKMMGMCDVLGNYFKDASMILTRGDPKVYSNADIQKELRRKQVL